MWPSYPQLHLTSFHNKHHRVLSGPTRSSRQVGQLERPPLRHAVCYVGLPCHYLLCFTLLKILVQHFLHPIHKFYVLVSRFTGVCVHIIAQHTHSSVGAHFWPCTFWLIPLVLSSWGLLQRLFICLIIAFSRCMAWMLDCSLLAFRMGSRPLFFFFFFVHRSILSCAWPTFLLRFWSAFRGVSFMRLPRFVAVCVKYWCLWSLFSTYLSQFSLPLGVRNFFAKLTVVCSCIFVRFFRLLTCACSSLVSVCAHMCCVLTRV